MDEIITLLLAWRMAKHYGENESKAIYLCAGKIWRSIEDDHVRDLVCRLALRKTPDYKRIEVVQRLEIGLRLQELL